ncbi:hypothetical protein EB796_018179 [Bugula neritina]|uniref:Uncharacterized protein n=1 Tax=Bugula neritina TaxID=10212 RepID=A0A7J7JD42_BUGNE|nr:hypothetical protein EB796_018179 [Bugula neritina]
MMFFCLGIPTAVQLQLTALLLESVEVIERDCLYLHNIFIITAIDAILIYADLHSSKMDSKVDPKGFELQDTSPPSADAVVKNGEKKPSTPAEPSQMSQRSSNGKPPPKPSKSSTLPSRNGLTNMSSNIENGPIDKAAEAQGKERLQLNVGYFKSWQAWLKIVKMLCLLAMLITLATSLSGITAKLPRISLYKPIWESLRTLRFGVALAVMGLVIEVTFFMIYLIGANSIITKHINLGVAVSLSNISRA